MPKLAPYSADLDYSYCLGVFPSLQLLAARPDCATRLLLHPGGDRNEGVARLREEAQKLGIREEEAQRVLRRESRKDNCYGGLVFEKYLCELRPRQPHVVLCQISDQGNLGTALRACLGFGFEDVAVVKPCCDIFDPRSVRASMGALFQMNVRVFDDFEAYRKLYPGHALYPFMLTGSRPLQEVAVEHDEPYALVFGNEQSGLPERFARMGQAVRIPQSVKIDSLNLAMAVSIGTYAFAAADRSPALR